VQVVVLPEQVLHPEQRTQVDDPVTVVDPVLQETLQVLSSSTLSVSQAVQVDVVTEQYLQLLLQSSQVVPDSMVRSSMHCFKHWLLYKKKPLGQVRQVELSPEQVLQDESQSKQARDLR